jgi:hypothetical protein
MEPLGKSGSWKGGAMNFASSVGLAHSAGGSTDPDLRSHTLEWKGRTKMDGILGTVLAAMWRNQRAAKASSLQGMDQWEL